MRSILSSLVAGAVLLPAAVAAAPVSTAFTYQGQLIHSGVAYTGQAGFLFRLYDAPSGGAQVGSNIGVSGLPVEGGLFTVQLDFGPVFDGNARWLEVAVQTPSETQLTTLSPRQALTAVPYALFSMNGGGGSSQWLSGASGVHTLGNVGIGTVADPNLQLALYTGTANKNPLLIGNNNPNYAALAVRNDAEGGIGFYDAWSDRHLILNGGRLGVGNATPGMAVDIVAEQNAGLRVTGTGNFLIPVPGEGVRAAMFVKGLTGTGFGGASLGGIYAASTDSRAVTAWTTTGWGVDGNCTSSGTYGVLGTPNEGVFGFSPNVALPAGKFMAPTNGIAIEALGLAKVKTLQITGGADLAEPFDVSAAGDALAEPGTVVVIDETQPGEMKVSDREYDTRVGGIISGARDLAPGMVMKAEGAEHADGAHPVALTGRVWCRVDASYGAIKPGDLLTTSPTAGHAMVASDPVRRSGAVLGKAMTSLEGGRGLVLVLVSLQ